MESILRILKKLAIFAQRRSFNSELEEEMSFHQDQAVKAFETEGLTAEAARHAAVRQFGNRTLLKERSNETIAFWFESAIQDLRFAIRQLIKNRGFACTAIFILALGICASTAIFAFVDAALIQPLPYNEPTRLVEVTEKMEMFPRANLSYPDYLDWKRMNTVFQSMDVYTGSGYLLRTPTGLEPVPALRVSDGFFRTLGVKPLLGRDFYSGEDRPESVKAVMISHSTWLNRFGGKTNVVGQTVLLSGVAYTIVGVLPGDFQFAARGNAEFFTTLQATEGCDIRRSCHGLVGVGRLKDGVTVALARANTESIAHQLEVQYPDSNRGQGASVIPLSEAIVGDIRPILLVLLGGSALLLLIACVNVSSLLLVRSESRRREMAVRGALGASRMRLIRQFVTEGLVLVSAGSLLGVATAYGAMHLLLNLISKDMLSGMPYLRGIGLTPHVLLFAAAISTLAAILFAATPIVRLPMNQIRDSLTEGARGSAGTLWRRFGANLVIVELAIAVVLLVAAGLLGKSFYRLLHVELNFQPDHLATVQVALPETSYSKDEQVIAVGRKIVDRVAALPGVQSAALSSMLPVSGNGNTDWIRFVGRPYDGHHNEVNMRDVSADYFKTLHVRLLSGRLFTDGEDEAKQKVVLINHALARKYFPGEDPIGKRFGNTELKPDSIKEIIGVVDDLKESALDGETWPAVYYPFNQDPDTYFNVVVRTSQQEQSILPALSAAVRGAAPDAGTIGETTMVARINDSSTAYLHRSSAWLVGGFAALALLLGIVGLYGVIAYSVSQRTREIGVRMALGAQRGAVYRLILQEAGWLTAGGIFAGLICAVLAATLMRKMLFGIHSWDVSTLAAVSGVLAVSALVASYVPARRAASVDPVQALRAE